MNRFVLLVLLCLCVPAVSFAQIIVTDADIDGNVTWTADNVYLLDGFVFVEDGETLTIEPGTVIQAEPGQGPEASALIVARGGRIFAEGNRNAPIIFTAKDDDVTDPTDIDPFERRLWGGVIVLGNAVVNTASGTGNIEGLPESARTEYGGDNDEDNSGILRYISIRHGGSLIGGNNEINGLTLGGVGSGTTIEHIEIFSNFDDGIEWFGGTAQVKYAISAFCGDDGFDYDEGWRGKGQFWLSIHASDVGGSAGEHDGGTEPEDGTPYSEPNIYNVTYIGSGRTSLNADNGIAINMRDNAGGHYSNSVFMDFPGSALLVEDLADGEDSRTRFEAGQLEFANNFWWDFGAGTTVPELLLSDPGQDAGFLTALAAAIAANGNQIADPQLENISRTNDGTLNVSPADGSPLLNASNFRPVPVDDFFTQANYGGAFNANENWMHGWTALEHYGFLAPAEATPIVFVEDGDIQGDVRWTNDKVYVLTEFVFVPEGSILRIDPGTVIQGEPGQGPGASALVVARGGQIFAEGTAEQPIIFTAQNDDVNDPNDIDAFARRRWGGVIILGNATINTASGTGNVEGLPESDRTLYGGNNDEDNSGVMRYVSIRHGGSLIGGNNEINGLTLAGVGSGSTFEYIEVFSNFDDGIEWFGGTAQVKYAVAAYCGDDGFDYDEGWRGKGQFWLSIHAEDVGGSGGEHDGGTEPEDGMPYSEPNIYNATYIGSGRTSLNADNGIAINMRDNAGGHYTNSIFTDYPGVALLVEDLADGQDSRARFEAGQLSFNNNFWWDFGAGSQLTDLLISDPGTDAGFITAMATNFAANGNQIANPELSVISRSADGTFDPRPAIGSPVLDDANIAEFPGEDGFFQRASYAGAFNAANNWLEGWTALDHYGFLTDRQVELDVVEVTDADMVGDVVWTSDKIYVLDGFVFVDAGESLTIQPGTIIKAKPGQEAQASALIISRGGRIDARGTSQNPIIFTAEDDDTERTDDIPLTARRLWGGVIILGNATINTASGTGNIEGLPESDRTLYGGDNDNESSGIMTYISIRHGGSLIGGNNEINGLTLGGVGSGTVLENIEVFANFDDGIEWFGGTAQVKWAASVFCGDDGFDYDEGWRGKGQFWLNYNLADAGGSGGEHDGGTEPEDGTPYSEPTIYNATYIGSGRTSLNADNGIAINMRDNAGGKYFNSIFTDFPGIALLIEDLADGQDSRARFEAGQIEFGNNIWWGFGAGNNLEDLLISQPGTDVSFITTLAAALVANGNIIADPMLRNIDARDNSWSFDPRPMPGSPALDAANVADVPAGDNFFTQAAYVGAFGQGVNWLSTNEWSATYQYGVISDVIDEEIVNVENNPVASVKAFPNPTTDNVWVRYNLPQMQAVTVKLVDARGTTVMSIVEGEQRMEGVYQLNLDLSDLSSGAYFFTVEGNGFAVSETINVVR